MTKQVEVMENVEDTATQKGGDPVVNRDRIAAPGYLWVCGACGRTGTDRYEMGDTSCVTWAVLCHEQKNADGSWQAVQP
jgi:hypothetical protein